MTAVCRFRKIGNGCCRLFYVQHLSIVSVNRPHADEIVLNNNSYSGEIYAVSNP